MGYYFQPDASVRSILDWLDLIRGETGVLREAHLFAGAFGGGLGGILCGHAPVCAVEIEEYARSVIIQRQRDGILPWFPIWDDVRTFPGFDWRGRVDIVCGGFPCQDISVAGKGAGIDGERSGLWSEMARIIREVGPRYVFVENSPALTARGLGRVLGDLAEMGYDCRWGCVSAEDAIWLGGPPAMDHLRERIWILGINRNANHLPHGTQRGIPQRQTTHSARDCRINDGSHSLGERCHAGGSSDRQDERREPDAVHQHAANANPVPKRRNRGTGEQRSTRRSQPADGSRHSSDADCLREQQRQRDEQNQRRRSGNCGEKDLASSHADNTRLAFRTCQRRNDEQELQTNIGICGQRSNSNDWWITEPELGRVAHGVAHRVDRLKSIGNGQVPAVAALAWTLLMDALTQQGGPEP